MATNESAIEAVVQQQIAAAPFSGVVLVHERGQTIFARAYGLAQRSEALPNMLDTRFATASGSKTFTSVAICQLVARGLLAFDTPLTACVPIPLPFDPTVTIHQLLTHTSGIPDYFDEAVEDDYEAFWHNVPVYRMRSPADFLPLFHDRPMQFAPGSRFHYNNAGFVVLALVVEHVAAMPFHRYVTHHVFEAAGMADSGYFATDQLPPRTAYGYIEDAMDGTWRTNIFAVPIIGGGDGGAYATGADIIAFWAALLDHRLLPESLTHAMLAQHAHAHEQVHSGYGIWITRRGNGALTYTMRGGDPGVTFSSSCYPERGVQIVAIGNVSGGAGAITTALEPLLGVAASP